MLNRRDLILFRLLFFCFYGTIGVMSPFLVLYFRSGLGLDNSRIALLSSLSGLAIILFQQLWGYAGDVRVSRKRLLIGATLLSAFLFLAVAELTHQWTLAAVLFIFYSVFTSISQLIYGFLFAHLHSEKHFGVLRAWGSLGFVVVNILVGIYADRMLNGSLTFIFPAFFALTAITAAVTMAIPEGRSEAPHRLSFMEVQVHFLRRPEVLLFLLMTFVYQAAHAPSYLLQAILMADMGADRQTIAYSYSLAAVLELPIFFLSAQLINRYGEHRLLVFCCGAQAIRWVLVWMSHSPYQVIATSAFHCITFGLFYAAAVTYMNHHAGPQLKASAQTLYALVYQGFAGLLGNIVGGQAVSKGLLADWSRMLCTKILHLNDHGDLPNLYISCSAAALLSMFMALALIRLDPLASRSAASRGLTPT